MVGMGRLQLITIHLRITMVSRNICWLIWSIWRNVARIYLLSPSDTLNKTLKKSALLPNHLGVKQRFEDFVLIHHFPQVYMTWLAMFGNGQQVGGRIQKLVNMMKTNQSTTWWRAGRLSTPETQPSITKQETARGEYFKQALQLYKSNLPVTTNNESTITNFTLPSFLRNCKSLRVFYTWSYIWKTVNFMDMPLEKRG